MNKKVKAKIINLNENEDLKSLDLNKVVVI